MRDNFERLQAKISEFESHKHIEDISGLSIFHALKAEFEQIHVDFLFLEMPEDSYELAQAISQTREYLAAVNKQLLICDGVRPPSTENSLPAAKSMSSRLFQDLWSRSTSPDSVRTVPSSPVNT